MKVTGLLLAVAVGVAAGSADAQAQYYGPYGNGYVPPQALPPSWSYDPYTSGQAPCPQGIHDENGRCRDRMPPTYGQPSYWPVR